MILSPKSECPQVNIFINGNKLKQKEQFKYLGILISRDKLDATEMLFHQRKLRNSQTTKKSVLREAGTTRSLINRICKHQVTFFGHVMKREKLEHL